MTFFFLFSQLLNVGKTEMLECLLVVVFGKTEYATFHSCTVSVPCTRAWEKGSLSQHSPRLGREGKGDCILTWLFLEKEP